MTTGTEYINQSFLRAMQIVGVSIGTKPEEHSSLAHEAKLVASLEKARIYQNHDQEAEIVFELNKRKSDPHELVSLVPDLVRPALLAYLCIEQFPLNFSQILSEVIEYAQKDSEIALAVLAISEKSITQQTRKTLFRLLDDEVGQDLVGDFFLQVKEARNAIFAQSEWHLPTPPSGKQRTRMERAFGSAQKEWSTFSLQSEPWYCPQLDKTIYLEFRCLDAVTEEWLVHELVPKGI